MNNINRILAEAEKIKEIKKTYPDLDITSDRWDRKSYTSKLAKLDVDKVELIHSCGCCQDALLYARFYLNFNDTKIYAEPLNTTIGERAGLGEDPYPLWKENLKKNGFTKPELIEYIENYFNTHTPYMGEDEDEYDEEGSEESSN